MSQGMPKWDLVRFLRTLVYFDVIPFIRNVGWLQQLIGRHDHKNGAVMEHKTGVILVAGATGGLGRRVVRRLVEQNYQVRSLVRDKQKARSLLGDKVELAVGDITQPKTLTPEVMADIKAVVCCTAVRVQPVEGDTPDRAKYYQGVKFYQPEVVGDTPEAVEYLGVKNLITAAASSLREADRRLIFNFRASTSALENTWGAVDDVVMGGVSESGMQQSKNSALFTGNVSTENSGGFASVRTRNFDSPLDLSQFNGIELRLRGDGKRYKFILRTEAKWDGTSYCCSFDTKADTWMTVYIPFADVIPVFRAKTLETAESFNPGHVCSFQLMLSKFEYDQALNPKFEPGAFQLELESIRAYGGVVPRFVLVSSAGVTRPGRPGINLESEPPAVRMNDQLGGILTWKLKGEDSVRESGIPYTIIRPCALTEEPGGKALVVDQGDNLKGKVSREDIAELCVQVLEQPEACNVTFEVKEDGDAPVNWEQLFDHLQPDSPVSMNDQSE